MGGSVGAVKSLGIWSINAKTRMRKRRENQFPKINLKYIVEQSNEVWDKRRSKDKKKQNSRES